MKRKWGAWTVAMLMAFGVAGCGDANQAAQRERVLKVAVSPDFSPFEFMDSQGKTTGFDVELIEALAQQMDRRLVLQNMSWDSLIPEVQSGNVDAIISAISMTPARTQLILFTDSYYQSGLAVMVRKGNSEIKGFEELKGRKVAVQIGTTGAIRAQRIPEVEVRDFDLNSSTFLELQNGGVDAVLNDLPVLQFYLKDQKDSGLEIVGPMVGAESYGIGLRKGNEVLAAEFNVALKKLKENGEYERLYEKWFGVKPPKLQETNNKEDGSGR